MQASQCILANDKIPAFAKMPNRFERRIPLTGQYTMPADPGISVSLVNNKIPAFRGIIGRTNEFASSIRSFARPGHRLFDMRELVSL